MSGKGGGDRASGAAVLGREASIDVLRGLAIFTMVAANMSAEGLAAPHPVWFRLYGTFAAPTFVTLAGMMVGYTARTRGHGPGYYVLRGFLVLAVGVVCDAALFRILPFTTVDVLYLTGLAIPIVFLFGRLAPAPRWILAGAVLAAGPILQHFLGYAANPTEFALSGELAAGEGGAGAIWRAWVVDGWFPVFPWLGFAMVGSNLASLRWPGGAVRSFATAGHLLAGAALVVAGAVVWHAMPGAMYEREGYGELFYPPTPGFILTAVGVVLTMLSVLDRAASSRLLAPFGALGGSSLFMYVFHIAVAGLLVARVWPERQMGVFLEIYGALVALMVCIGFGLRALRRRWRTMPFLARFLLGG